jgi:genome maintenance exonuclease 1
MDFKNSRSFRKEEWISDYKLQVVAYGLAHNEMYNTKIRKGVIMLAAQTGQYQEWIVEGNDFDKAADEWAKRLEEYYAKHG